MSLVLEKISKNFGGTMALKGVSLTLKKGEIVGLLGPNGAGKSTLMRILTGFYKQWEGKGTLFEKDLKTELRDIQKQIGYLTENNPLYPEMYVKEYIKYIADLYRLKNPPIESIIKQTGLEEYQFKKIQILSKGYRQRVGLAAALIHKPNLLILDEPTTGLDPIMAGVINQLIREIVVEMGATAITITHDMASVRAIADKVAMIHNGSIQWSGTVKEMEKSSDPYLNQFLRGDAEGPIEAIR